MATSSVELLMRKCNVPEELIKQMRTSMESLSLDAVLGGWGNAPVITGLSASEGELLVIRMLQRLASRFGMGFDASDFPELVGMPDLDELLDKVSNAQVACLLRAECHRLLPNPDRHYERG